MNRSFRAVFLFALCQWPLQLADASSEAYDRYLHGLLLAGDIRQYRYEPMRFNLAPLTTITPDFQVVTKEGQMEYHEVKGFAREDAMAKLKICARLYPEWKFWLVKRKRGVWELKELPV